MLPCIERTSLLVTSCWANQAPSSTAQIGPKPRSQQLQTGQLFIASTKLLRLILPHLCSIFVLHHVVTGMLKVCCFMDLGRTSDYFAQA